MNEEQLREFAEARVGTVLCDKWTLEGLLGVGGTASVYSAMHRNGKRVAVKILHPELSAQKQFRDRFLREGYVGNHIEHEGAITVHDDAVTVDDCVVLVMDLLEGENLEARRERKGGRLHPLEVLSLMDDILDTLTAAHGRGVVHRDIKPENLFLTNDNRVKLLDFGIARIDVIDDPGKTLAGIAMGTPAFMPPEQASARWDQVDAQSDLWALGASMFTLLTGRYVHEGGTVNESLAMAVTRPAPSLESVDPTLPAVVCEIVNKALYRERGMRWATAAEMQHAVRLAYKELQDAPEDQRYSISHGPVSSHSAPPNPAPVGALLDTDISDAMDANTGEPVSTDLIARFGAARDPKRKAIAAIAGLAALIGLLAAIGDGGDGGDEEELQPAAGAASPAPTPAEPIALTVKEVSALPKAEVLPTDPGASEESAGTDSENPEDESDVDEEEKKARVKKRWVPRSKPDRAGEPFDPFEKRD